MELMIVMVILGILVAMGLTSYKSVQMKSRDGRRKSDMRQISSALELYYNDKGQYPLDDGSGKMKGCGAGATETCTWGTIMKDDTKSTIYMVKLPGDPASGWQYYYDAYGSQGKGYQLYARLENSQDIDLSRDGFGNTYYYMATVCTTGNKKCNFGVASPNLTLDDSSQGHTKTITD